MTRSAPGGGAATGTAAASTGAGEPRWQRARHELHRRRQLAETVGGDEAVRRQHERGLLTAPERVALLLDPGSDVPFGPLVHGDDLESAERTFGDGELAGFGRVNGRWVGYFASDPRVKGASGTPATFRHSDAFRSIVERAALPLVHLMQGGGARMTDAMSSSFVAFPGTGLGARRAFPRRGVLITAVMGSYFAPWTVAQADFSVMTETSNISLTAPPLVMVGTGQEVTAEELGGSAVQGRISGQIDRVVADDAACVALVRRVLGYLPPRAGERPPDARPLEPARADGERIGAVVPQQMSQGYDVREVVAGLVDAGSFIEWSPTFAPNVVTGLARVNGRTVVVLANQPSYMAGVIDVRAVRKARKVVRLAADFSLPLLSLIDTPGVLPTKEEEHARLMTELYDFGVERLKVDAPKVAVVLRKGIGFALQAMSGGDPEAFTFAWPNSQIAFTGPEAAARITYRRAIEAAGDPDAEARRLTGAFEGRSTPWEAARLAYIDDVIEPTDTRRRIVRALEAGTRPS